MNDTESLQYLQNLEKFGIKLGLEKITLLLQTLQNPDKAYPIIIVGGTNGKGSVSVMLSSILEDAGYRTGTYLSPHLIRPEERIRVDGRDISPALFSKGLWRVKLACDSLVGRKRCDEHPTFFEVLTALALCHFKDERVDMAVMEVGLGGRLDATNATPAILSIITNVSLDHQEYLGKKISLIAREKGGIIKQKGILVSGAANGEVNETLSEICLGKKAKYYSVHDQVRSYIKRDGNRLSGNFQTGGITLKEVSLAMQGRHQMDNAATAFLSAIVLRELGFDIPLEAMRSGLERARLGGRLEMVHRRPRWIIDGAHNKDAAEQVADYVRHMPDGSKYLVFGAMKDKDVAGMMQALFPLFQKILLVPVTGQKSRSMAPGEIKKHGLRYNRNIEIYSTVKECYSGLSRILRETDTVICAGSIFLAGEIKAFFSSRRGEGDAY